MRFALEPTEVPMTTTAPGLVVSLVDYRPSPRYDGNPWTGALIEGATTVDGVWSEIQTVTFSDPDGDPITPKKRNFTIEDIGSTINYLRVTFTDDEAGGDTTVPLPVNPVIGNLTTVRDVRVRLGRDLTDEEMNQIDSLIVLTTISIYASIGQSSTWVPSPNVVPFMHLMAIEVVCRGMVNPGQLFQRSETIGGYSYSELYTPRGEKSVPGLFLTPAETLVLRQVVFGTNTGSVKVRSFADEYAEIIWPYAVQYGLYYGNLSDPIIWR